jgi:mannose-6-phosphate isomerase-like protein (cupin superfamily)
LIYARTERYVGKVLHINAGEALSLQYHERKDETLYLSAGEVVLLVEEDGAMVERRLGSGESYRIRPFVKHRMIGGPQGCDLLEVSTPELDDVVRLEDRYGRS